MSEQSRVSWSETRYLVLIGSLLVVLFVGFAGGLSLAWSLTASSASRTGHLRDRIRALESEIQGLDRESQAPGSQGNPAHAMSLNEEIASKCQEQARLLDNLATQLPRGPERDECASMAVDRKNNATQIWEWLAAARSSR